MRRLFCALIFLIMASTVSAYASDKSNGYIDIPYFNLLPMDNTIDQVIKRFGESTVITSPLSHYSVLYYDYSDKLALIFYVYQVDSKTIWGIEFLKEHDLQRLYNLLSNSHESSQTSKPHNLRLPQVLTKNGLKIGMSQKAVESILRTKLDLSKDNQASLIWNEPNGDRYGSMSFKFTEGKLTSLSWYGVDP